MAKDLPPYFNIDAEAALADLDAPSTTQGFARIAEACARGRTDPACMPRSVPAWRGVKAFSFSAR